MIQRFPRCCNPFPDKGNAFCNRTEAHALMVGLRHKLLNPDHFHYPRTSHVAAIHLSKK